MHIHVYHANSIALGLLRTLFAIKTKYQAVETFNSQNLAFHL